MPDNAALRATALDIASCTVFGTVREGNHCEHTALSPLTALEQSMVSALQRPPCVVSFSGGMDSSFVLAVATHVARRAGLAPPIPVTWRFTDAPHAEESAWQERVIAALPGLDWQFLHAVDDLDLIGPVAQRVLTRHGALLPPNLHLHLPIIELAAGGSLLTGVGGDQIFVGAGRRERALLRSYAPGRAVAMLRHWQGRDQFPWLRPSISRQLFARTRSERRNTPRAFDRRIRWQLRQRDLLMTCANLDTVAGDQDVQVVNPLLGKGFIDALAASMRDRPTLSRSAAFVAIADGQVPAAATATRPKARFLEVFLRAATRQFVQSWDGHGADERVVDPVALRAVWSDWPIPAATAGLVQQLWLSSRNSPLAAQEAPK